MSSLRVEDLGRPGALAVLGDLGPQLDQVANVGLELLFGKPLGDGAHDEPTLLRPHRVDDLAQTVALASGTDSLAHPSVFDGRQVDDVAARERDVAGDTRTLGANGLLRDLDDDLVALFHDLGDGHRASHPELGALGARALGLGALLWILTADRLGIRLRGSPAAAAAAAPTTLRILDESTRALVDRDALGRRLAFDHSHLRRLVGGRGLRGGLTARFGCRGRLARVGTGVVGIRSVLVFVLVLVLVFVLVRRDVGIRLRLRCFGLRVRLGLRCLGLRVCLGLRCLGLRVRLGLRCLGLRVHPFGYREARRGRCRAHRVRRDSARHVSLGGDQRGVLVVFFFGLAVVAPTRHAFARRTFVLALCARKVGLEVVGADQVFDV